MSKQHFRLLVFGSILLTSCVLIQRPTVRGIPTSTFSIVGYDPEKREWGVAVASRVLAVGAVVQWAKSEVGAVATQSFANPDFGPDGLKLMSDGKTAQEALDALIAADEGREMRQVGVVDVHGNAAHFTGKRCFPWAGAQSGENYACQGNLLSGKEVISSMAEAFENTKGPLTWRLMAALEAGEKAGGDRRGKQSAAILVVRKKAGWNGLTDRYVDLRVDDHAEPVRELKRIVELRVRPPAD